MLVLDSLGGHVHALAFSTDNGSLYALYERKTVRVWNLASRAAVPLSTDLGQLHDEFVPVPGGTWAASCVSWATDSSNRWQLVDLRTGSTRTLPIGLIPTGHLVAPLADGARLITHSPGHGARPSSSRLRGWRVTLDGPEHLWHRDLPPDDGPFYRPNIAAIVPLGGERFAAVVRIHAATDDIQITVRRAADGEPDDVVRLRGVEFDQLLGSPDGTQFVARRGTELRVWDATDWNRPPVVVEGKPKPWMIRGAACFHPSGEFLLLANGATSAVAFETRTWKPVRKWNWKVGVLRVVAVSPDGTLAAAGGPGGDVVVWDWDV